MQGKDKASPAVDAVVLEEDQVVVEEPVTKAKAAAFFGAAKPQSQQTGRHRSYRSTQGWWVRARTG